jgi:hypothetical protein
MPYHVMVDDNFHYMDASSRYCIAVVDTAAEALTLCREVVDDYLDSARGPGDSHDATGLLASYRMFGEDAFIVARDAPPVRFSAWDYAAARCEELCRTPPRQPLPSKYDPDSDDYDPLA